MANETQWDKVAEEYDQVMGESRDFNQSHYLMPSILKMLGEARGSRVLDLGCGGGYLSVMLAKRGAKVVGVDSSERMVAIAKERTPRGIRVRYLVGDASEIKGVGRGAVDCIVSNMVFHNLSDIEGAASECARVLKRGGRLIFSMVHPLRYVSEIKKDRGGYYAEVRGYGRNHRVLNRLVKKNNWSRVYAYHRPLGFYLSILISAGFVISGFDEIYNVHHNGVRIADRELLEFKKTFPSFLVVQCTKLGEA